MLMRASKMLAISGRDIRARMTAFSRPSGFNGAGRLFCLIRLREDRLFERELRKTTSG